MLTIILAAVFLWILFKAFGLVLHLAWGIFKVIGVLLMILAAPLFLGIVLVGGALALLAVPIGLVALACGIGALAD